MRKLLLFLAATLATALAPTFHSAGHAAGAEFVLALSWQPAFCEGAPRRPECRSQTAARFDASHFALHGLWPQPSSRSYCGVAGSDVEMDKGGEWKKLPMDRLPAGLRASLAIAMPGTMSGLDRHEWLKHGTCIAGATPQTYFGASLALLETLNASAVRDLFASRIGREVSGEEVRAAFDAAFGAGAGSRVRLACRRDDGRRLVAEITIGLSGTFSETPDLAKMVAAAAPTNPGCPAGIVDSVGLQ